MPLKEDLEKEVADFFSYSWSERKGTVVPEQSSLRLANDAIQLDATVLYADMADSTILVDTKKPWFAAEVYKAFLHCAAKIIQENDGQITAYDGDRVMAVFIGDYKNSNATKTALQINWACKNIINPAISNRYGAGTYELNHVVGVDTSEVYVARTGVRGANDLVWVGRASNHAAKMAAMDHNYPSYISAEVYKKLPDQQGGNPKANIWQKFTWEDMGRDIYRSTWWWNF